MKQPKPSVSLYVKLIACLILSSLVMVGFSSLYVFEAWQVRQQTGRIAELSRGAEFFVYAFRDLTFERGRTNVALSGPQGNSMANRAFIAERRAQVDQNFKQGIEWLLMIDPLYAQPLQTRYAVFLSARAKVDEVLQADQAVAEPALRSEWLTASTDLAEQIIFMLDFLGKRQQVSGRYSAYHLLIVDALEFRNLIGKSATLMTAATSRRVPWTGEEYKKHLELQAQADFLWGKMTQTINASDSVALQYEMAGVEQLYYRSYRQEQMQLLPEALAGTVSPERLAQIQSLSVVAFDSVFSLIDQIKQDVFADMRIYQDEADRKLMETLLHLYVSMAIVAFTLMYFQAKLFQPLRAITGALENIRRGEAAPLLDNENRRTDEIGQLAAGAMLLQSSMDEERRLRGLHEHLAMIDALTGCLNKRSFYQRAELELTRALRESKVAALVLLDLDNMKQVNDTYGHLYGDKLLKHLVSVISEQCRPYDLIGRFGGDEFMLFMQASDETSVMEACLRVHSAVRSQPVVLPELTEPLMVRISMGVVYGEIQTDTPLLAYLEQADKALYAAKQQGKDQVVFRKMVD